MDSENDTAATKETPSTNLESSLPPRPPTLEKRKPLRITSNLWDHFTRVKN